MNAETEFMIREKKEGSEGIFLYVQGDLNANTSSQLRHAMNHYFSSGLQHIQVVLDEVPRMDSSGIATLVEGLRWSRKTGNHFILSGMTDAVHDLFVLSKLNSEFEIVSSGAKP